MIKELFTDIPEYVRITIYSQTRRLLNYSFFDSSVDREDILQSLLMFYIEKFRNKDIPSESYVVTSIKNEATRLIKVKMREHLDLLISLDDIVETHEFIDNSANFHNKEFNVLISAISKQLDERERIVLKMILDGKTLDEISKNIHISKNTIYKIFNKIKKFCNFGERL